MKNDTKTVPVVAVYNDDDLYAASAMLADATAVDTETHYDGNDEVVAVAADGTEIRYRRRLDVDGPGPLRVISAAGVHRGKEFAVVIDAEACSTTAMSEVLGGREYAAWNAPFDARVFADAGITGIALRDLMLADQLLRCGIGGGNTSRYSLARAIQVYLGGKAEGKGTTQLSYRSGEPLTSEQVRYAADDAVHTARLDALLIAELDSHGMAASFRRNVAAQAFITSMTFGGLALDVAAYRNDVVETARGQARDAAQRIALLTGGADTLAWLDTVADGAGIPGKAADLLPTAEGWSQLRAALEEVKTQAATRLAVAAGGQTMAEDLFSAGGGPTVIPPFDPGSDTEVRRWLSKRAPLFVASFIAAANSPHLTVGQALARTADNPDEVLALAGGRTRLLTAHNLDDVLSELAAADVDADLRTVARELATYRRAAAFLADHADEPDGVALTPTWKVNNSAAAKDAFNRWAPDEVRGYFAAHHGKARLFGPADTIDSDTLALMGGDLAQAMADYRDSEKLVSTYGDKFLAYVHPVTGRLHSSYAQARTATGRLASSSPNAQNFAPVIKRYARPANGRVLVCVDLSQAELRYLAAAAADEAMIAAFGSGEDLHARTASLMFGIDMAALAALAAGQPAGDGEQAAAAQAAAAQRAELLGTDLGTAAAKLRKELRQKAKKVSFGYAYGIGAAKLAHDLTVDGVPTTPDEAKALIGLFNDAYPQAAAWMSARASYIADRAADIVHGRVQMDWAGTWRTWRAWKAVKDARAVLGRDAEAADVSARIASDEVLASRIGERGETADAAALEAERARHAQVVEQMDAIDVPLLTTADGDVWEFASFTAGGTVRRFAITAADWEWGVVQAIVKSRNPRIAAAREDWIVARNTSEAAAVASARAAGRAVKDPAPIVLASGRRPLRGKELEKMFEDRARRTSLVEHVAAAAGAAREDLFREGAADRVRAAGNQYRNHPIQAGVADAVLDAMARIWADKPAGAQAVQSVHDSIVIECDADQAPAVLAMSVKHMEQALAVYAPGVAVKADGDIQASLDDSTKLDIPAAQAA